MTDFDEEEIARRHTLSASPAYAEWKKTKIHLIDTPGIANFFSDTCCALRVADAAVVVVDAIHGAEVITEKVWDEAAALDLPCVVVLNRLDRERGESATFARVAAERVRTNRGPHSASDRRRG